ncbi:MAG: hypothetical protein GF418_10580 [Chitinivibrionales bacterium]|nr:hypothetical protein [Chitinivibrionales bacterium]MBD3396059.1 hypothetical protein [Chitinivibrionales bacterium]
MRYSITPSFHCVYVRVLALLLAFPFSAGLPGIPRGAGAVSGEELFEVDSEKVRDDIERYLDETERHIEQSKIRDARQGLSLLEQKVDLHKKHLSRQERELYKDRINELSSAAEHAVDSLVEANLKLLKTKGSAEAIEFRRYLAAQCGISEAELAPVDEAIVTSGPVEQKQRERELHEEASRVVEKAAAKEPEKAVAGSEEIQKIEDKEVRAVAERIARARQDSIRAEEARKDSIRQVQAEKLRRLRQREQSIATANENARKIESLLAEGNPEEAKTVFDIYEANLTKFLEGDRFERLGARVTTAYEEHRKMTAWASQASEKILALVEAKKGAGAHAAFVKDRDDLAKYLDEYQFTELTREVESAYETYRENREDAQSAATRIGSYLDRKKVERAYELFGRSREMLSSYLDQKVFDALQSRVETAYGAMQDRKKWAEGYAGGIESLIDRDEGAEAYQRFEKERASLKEYLRPREYESLAASVTAARAEYAENRTKAQAAAKKLRALISAGKADEAYDGFGKIRESLRHYLGGGEFEELRADVYESHRHLMERRRWAQQYVRGIYSLISQKEGEAAYAQYQKEKAGLREYAPAETIDSLESAVLKARADYRTNQTKAQAAAKKIQGLLARNQAQEAYAAFQKAKDHLDHYLGDDELFDEIGARVADAYRAFQEKKRFAEQYAREIAREIDRREGLKADSLYQAKKTELHKYLESSSANRLAAAVAAARSDYVKNREKAREIEKRARGLLTAGKIEQGYRLFDENEDNLGHYLLGSSFGELRTWAEKEYKSLLASRRWAVDQVREIEGLVRREEGARAHAQFDKHKRELQKYLDAETYKALQAKAVRARSEHAARKKRAVKIAGRIVALLDQKRAKEAYTLFDENEDDLRRFTGPKSFAQLEKRVEAVYDDLKEKERWAVQQTRSIKGLVRRRRPEEARDQFTKLQAELTKYLDAGAFTSLEEQVAAAYRQYRRNVGKMVALEKRIRALIRSDSLDAAHDAFLSNEADLKRYLGEEARAKIEQMVMTPYRALMQKREKAEEYASTVYKLLRKNEIVGAHKTFTAFRPQLQATLDAKSFTRLQKTVVEKYNDYMANSRKARVASDRIYDLLRADEVDSAYAGFRKIRLSLRRYLDNHSYEKLEKSVARAYEHLTGRRREAEDYARENVYDRLKKGETWPAYRNFRSKRTWLRKYLEKDDFEELEKQVNVSYKGMRGKR